MLHSWIWFVLGFVKFFDLFVLNCINFKFLLWLVVFAAISCQLSSAYMFFACFDAFYLLQRESAMQRRISILQNTQTSMSQICRRLSLCKALNPRDMCERLLHGCTITGTSLMMGLSF